MLENCKSTFRMELQTNTTHLGQIILKTILPSHLESNTMMRNFSFLGAKILFQKQTKKLSYLKDQQIQQVLHRLSFLKKLAISCSRTSLYRSKGVSNLQRRLSYLLLAGFTTQLTFLRRKESLSQRLQELERVKWLSF